MRLIDADAIKLPKGFFEEVDSVPKFYEWLNEQPTIDQKKLCEMCRLDDCIALTQKKGKWERPVVNGLTCLTAICSVCGYVNNSNDGFKYCPNCGAHMEMEGE